MHAEWLCQRSSERNIWIACACSHGKRNLSRSLPPCRKSSNGQPHSTTPIWIGSLSRWKPAMHSKNPAGNTNCLTFLTWPVHNAHRLIGLIIGMNILNEAVSDHYSDGVPQCGKATQFFTILNWFIGRITIGMSRRNALSIKQIILSFGTLYSLSMETSAPCVKGTPPSELSFFSSCMRSLFCIDNRILVDYLCKIWLSMDKTSLPET